MFQYTTIILYMKLYRVMYCITIHYCMQNNMLYNLNNNLLKIR